MSLTITDHAIQVAYDIPYRDENIDDFHDERQRGDLYLPADSENAPIALIIHGGGWKAMDKNSFAGVAEFFAMHGYAAFAINYRLLRHAPYPACYEDCLAAAAFMANTDHVLFQNLDRSNLVVCGGSAGGHLCLMTGLTCASIPVRAIINIAGPSNLNKRLDYDAYKEMGFMDDPTPEALAQASPVTYVNEQSAPLLCIHSTNDELVTHSHSEEIVALYKEKGLRAELHSFAGDDKVHGIWPAGSGFPHDGPEGRLSSGLKHLIPPLEARLADFIKTI